MHVEDSRLKPTSGVPLGTVVAERRGPWTCVGTRQRPIAGLLQSSLHFLTVPREQNTPCAAQRLGPDPMLTERRKRRFMLSELYLQLTARERLASGRLPRRHSQCIWGGYGRGDVCSLCGEPIRSTEVEFEVPEPEDAGQHDSHSHAAPAAALKFHITCHAVWQLECVGDDAAPGRPQNAGHGGGAPDRSGDSRPNRPENTA